MAGLEGLLDKSKPKTPSLEDEYTDEAYHALRDGDREAFRTAFQKAVRACVRKNASGEYDTADEPDDAEG